MKSWRIKMRKVRVIMLISSKVCHVITGRRWQRRREVRSVNHPADAALAFSRGQSRIEDFEMIIGRPAPPPKRNQPINGIEIHRPINGKLRRGRARITAAVGWRGVKLKN
jgi:hypothetical protein